MKPKAMTLAESAVRMTRLLARKPRKAVTRAYLAAMPKRATIVVTAADYHGAESEREKDARRYAEWVARGKPPSPSQPVQIRRRPKARERTAEHWSLLARMVEAQGNVCPACGCSLAMNDDLDDPMRPSIDHVVPKALGGADRDNRIAMHRVCNGRKADRLPTGCERVFLAIVVAKLTPAGIPDTTQDGRA